MDIRETRKNVGRLIKLARKEKNLTQSQLNEKLGYEPSSIFLSKIERGIVSLPEHKIPDFAKCLDLSETEIYAILKPDEANAQIAHTVGSASKPEDLLLPKLSPDMRQWSKNHDLLNALVLNVHGDFLEPIAQNNQKIILKHHADLKVGDFIVIEFSANEKRYYSGKLIKDTSYQITITELSNKKKITSLRKKDITLKAKIIGVLF
jgi:transcriptional regulator with XRE-family HTH domain